MALGEIEMTDSDTDHDSNEGRVNKYSKYRIAIVLGGIAVSLYVLSILSLVFSRGGVVG